MTSRDERLRGLVADFFAEDHTDPHADLMALVQSAVRDALEEHARTDLPRALAIVEAGDRLAQAVAEASRTVFETTDLECIRRCELELSEALASYQKVRGE